MDYFRKPNALQIAGWCKSTRNNIENFKLVDTESLTPLLMVLNNPNPLV